MTRTAALRLSILVSMGVVPLACSGKMVSGGDENDGGVGTSGGSGGTSQGTAAAGKPIKGGAPSTGSGGAANHGGTTSKAGSPHVAGAHGCTNGKLDPVTGLVSCEEGYWARPFAKQCERPETGAGGVGGEPSLPRADGRLRCDDDLDCETFDQGYCRIVDDGGAGESSYCDSGCVNDTDCGEGHICICSASSNHGGTCLRSDCQTNADCGTGFVCATFAVPCGPDGMACTTEQDECPSSECPAEACAFDSAQGHRVCDESVCGRPFLVEQQARVAAAIADSSWSEHVAPRVSHLTPSERAALAAHWTKLGQMEHASIAAFARFQLQLLALGAPPELVQACNQALIDETAHTRLCFGLASAYAGHGIGPGPLDVAHSLDVTSLADIVDLVLAEGCFGETNAALEALEAADAARDPVIHSAYARIAEDEQRHAELAFRFVQWAVKRDARIASRVERALIHSSDSRTSRDVVRPCLRAVLAA